MMMIIINEGKITPIEAIKEPKKPACVDPTKVAMLIAIGPGVDSQTPKKLINSSSVNQL